MEDTPIQKAEAVLRKVVKANNDSDYKIMAKIIMTEDINGAGALHNFIGEYIVGGEDFNKNLKKILTKLFKGLEKEDLVGAKKASSTQNSATPQRESEQEPTTEESTPGTQYEESKYGEAYGNADGSRDGWMDKKAHQFAQRKQDEIDKADAAIDRLLATKEKIPPPRVMHDKSELYQADIFLPQVTIIAGNALLIEEATVHFSKGRKYGMIGRNGTGKTTLINAICRKEIDKMPQNVHILQVEQEVPGDDKTILDHVLECDEERLSLLKEAEEIPKMDKSTMTEDEIMASEERLREVIDQLDLIEAEKAPAKATIILKGLGFTEDQLDWPSNKFSGGWRMRISIAKVVFCEPEVLMLDEPTNHLDLVALIWLEQYIQKLDITVVVISHARDFLNAVVDEIIELENKKLTYYKGNFDTYQKTKGEQTRNRIKKREYQLEEIAHNQAFVDQFRANAKRAKLVQSRCKVIEKIKEDMEAEIYIEPAVVFKFPTPPELNRPILRITDGKIGYDRQNVIISQVNLEIDMDTKIAFVGPNGAGKSTLLNTLIGKLDILDGNRIINGKVKVGVFNQHHMEVLNPRLTALEFFHERFPQERAEQLMRHLGSFGVTDKLALKPMALLSGGQKSRVSFALITFEAPQVLLLDEPTNHLDYDAINALIESLQGYKGGLCVVSHDQYFLNALCDRISIVEDGKVNMFDGTINDYIKALRKKHAA